MTALIPDSQILEHFSMAQCIDAVERAFSSAADGGVDLSERKVVAVEDGARLLSLTAASSALGSLVANIYTGAPSGGDKRSSSVNRRQKFYLLFAADTGACLAIISGGVLAQWKTGAVGAVAIRHIAPIAAEKLAIIGSGRQARMALEGALEVRDFAEVQVWSPSPGNALRMASDYAHLEVDIMAADSAEDAVREADVVITATTSPYPVIADAWLANGAHINSIGAHYPQARELTGETVSRSTVFVDTLVAARAEKGELLLAESEGLFTWSDVTAELGDLVSGRSTWRPAVGENTLFASCGSAIESLGAALGALEAIPESERHEFAFDG